MILEACGLKPQSGGGLTTCLADMMVQMKIPNETKPIDRYLLTEYLQREKKNISHTG